MDIQEKYQNIFDKRTPEEVRQLAHTKRFMERVVADPVFRDKLRDSPDDYKAVTDEYGIDVDAYQLLPMFKTDHLKYRHSDEEYKWPLAHAWSNYILEMGTHRDLMRDHGDAAEANPVFNNWRERQIARSMSELGISGPSITHPLAAYELSDGCSVGCWFCGISAEKFEGYLPYTEESGELWRGILQTLVDAFGTAAQTGFCYWASDPMDNPDYDKYIEDHYKITGFLPQTTTAAPLKDVALTRRVLALFDKYRSITNRFSVINLKLLDKIHQEFTPEELMGVEIVAQNREAIMAKANAGRARERRQKLREAGKDESISIRDDDHSTIACVSGFLVNMPNQTVRMVSPTRGGDRWPLGYRVYDEQTFTDADDFRRIIAEMVDRHCVDDVRPDDYLAFREDLTYAPLSNGFELKNAAFTHTYKGLSLLPSLGVMIAQGDLTAGEIQGRLVDDGYDVFLVGMVLKGLLNGGLLDDDPKYGGIGTGHPAVQAKPDAETAAA